MCCYVLSYTKDDYNLKAAHILSERKVVCIFLLIVLHCLLQ